MGRRGRGVPWRARRCARRARARVAALPFHTSFFPGACGDGTNGYSHLGLQERLPAWGCNAAATRAAFEWAGGADGPVRLRLSCVEVAVVGVGCGAPDEAGGRGELRVVGAARACAPLPDIPLFDFPVDPLPPAGLRVTVVARRDRGGGAPAIVLVPGDRRAARVAVAPPTPSPPGRWATVSVVVPPADLPGGLASVAVRAGGGGGGAFAGRVASLALADAAWAPPLSPAATSISTTPCDDGDTLALAWGAPPTGVARWELWRARAGSPPEWLAAARLPRVALPRQPPGADIIVQAVFGDGGREALGGAARARGVRRDEGRVAGRCLHATRWSAAAGSGRGTGPPAGGGARPREWGESPPPAALVSPRLHPRLLALAPHSPHHAQTALRSPDVRVGPPRARVRGARGGRTAAVGCGAALVGGQLAMARHAGAAAHWGACAEGRRGPWRPLPPPVSQVAALAAAGGTAVDPAKPYAELW